MSLTEKEFVLKSRRTLISILEGEDPRKLLIMGPCSIHDMPSAYEYADKLKRLSEQVEDSFFIVMRAYFEKPRTSLNWRGFLHDPFLDGSHHIKEGLSLTRQLLKELTQREIPLACEFLDPAAPYFLSDYITWGCVGARTTSSQIHRHMASHLDLPVGFKNSIEGNVDIALHAIDVAKAGHKFIGLNLDGKLTLVHSKGNPHSHLVLRGGEKRPNYEAADIQNALKSTPHLIVDCSHDNSRKIVQQQKIVFENVLDQILEGNSAIRGLMLESFLEEGSQPISPTMRYGLSITDPCLGFAATESLILNGAQRLALCALSS